MQGLYHKEFTYKSKEGLLLLSVDFRLWQKCWCSLLYRRVPGPGGQLALANVHVKEPLLFPGAADEKLVSAEELCDVLYCDVSYDLMIKR